MYITGLKIDAFGKFIDKTMTFSDGLNIIYGNNEAGKSTTHAFIKAMLFGLKRNKGKVSSALYQKYYPWDVKNVFGGSLTFIYNNEEYKLTRNFNITNQTLEIINITNPSKQIDNPELFLNVVLHNINSQTFDNTISIQQLKAAQDSSMVDELHKIISNLNTSGNMSIDTLFAINYLLQEKETLLKNINNDAPLVYNRELSSIRNIERELSNEKYENKLGVLSSKKMEDAKLIEKNSLEIESLKKELAEKTLRLDEYGFSDKKDIDSLSSEVNKIYLEYKQVAKHSNPIIRYALNIISIVAGIILTIVSFLLLVATYPDVASILKLHDTRYSMNTITNFVINLPFHPIILIALLICVGTILLLGGIILLINNLRSNSTSKELENILSDIFTQHINSNEIDDNNFMKFKKHMKEMRTIVKIINEFETRILLLTEENNSLLANQAEYIEEIKSQQKIQSDVEQKYNELYKLRIENEKTKLILEKNDAINNDIESINLAIDTIKNLSNEIQISFGTHLNKTASKYISILTNNKYSSLNVDNALNTTINFEGKNIPLSLTSAGTIDQIYLALRLAISDIINTNNNILPLIFDDCFAMYDNDRLKATLEFLHKNIDTQVIIFSCHTREKEFADKLGLNFNYIEI